MPTINLTDEELAVAFKVFNSDTVQDHMINRRRMSTVLFASIYNKLSAAISQPAPKPGNSRIDAIWDAVKGYQP